MLMIFIGFMGLAIWAEEAGNPAFDDMGVSQAATQYQPGGNMEGQGGQVRGGPLLHLRGGDDGDVLWGGGLHARFVYALRRDVAPVPDPVR